MGIVVILKVMKKNTIVSFLYRNFQKRAMKSQIPMQFVGHQEIGSCLIAFSRGRLDFEPKNERNLLIMKMVRK